MAYLTFNGNCKEAMTFYQACLGGELTFQTVGESVTGKKVPKQMKECIVHAMLKKESLILLASDMTSQEGLIKGNAIALALECRSKEDIKNVYSKLATNGYVEQPLQKTIWGAVFGVITDQFGHQWLLNYSKK